MNFYIGRDNGYKNYFYLYEKLQCNVIVVNWWYQNDVTSICYHASMVLSCDLISKTVGGLGV